MGEAPGAPVRQEIIDLYDAYVRMRTDRSAFLHRLAELAGGAAEADALLPRLENAHNPARVRPDHHDLVSLRVQYEGGSGALVGYLARRRGRLDAMPPVLLVHDNRGLSPHVEDVARRLAMAGYLVLAPDLLSPRGGTPAGEALARRLVGELEEVAVAADLTASVTWLRAHREGHGRVGCLGFGWGGGCVQRLAAFGIDLAAVVAYYGAAPPVAAVPRIRAPLLLHYAGFDEPVNRDIAAFEAALREAGKRFTVHRYEDVHHGFHDHHGGARHDPEAAELAWARTLRFLEEHLAA
ncbi:MAG: dienelactone hydrolase family protein [Gammaproteobacteria bacterium]|nr:dienelactone hydrolase family protein [Gammaproteobacteria bacterium]